MTITKRRKIYLYTTENVSPKKNLYGKFWELLKKEKIKYLEYVMSELNASYIR